MSTTRIFTIITYTAILFFLCSTAWSGTKEDVAALEPGKWYEIKNENFTNVWCDSKYQNCFDGYSPTFNSGNPYNYSGGVYDSKQNRHIVWGGGHAAWGGNEIYAYDFNNFAWVRLSIPATKEEIQSCDEQTEDCDGYYAPHQPVMRHTYNELAFDPNNNRLYTTMAGSQFCNCSGKTEPNFDYYDFNSGSWTGHGDLPDNPLGISSHNSTVIDESTGDIWIIGNESNARGDIWQWKKSTNTWIKRYDGLPYPNGDSRSRYPAAFDQDRKCIILLGNGVYYNIDLSNPSSWISSPGTYIPSSAINSNYTGDTTLPLLTAYPGPVLSYDHNIKRIIGWTSNQTIRSDIYVIDSLNNHIVKVAASFGSAVPVLYAEDSGIHGRFIDAWNQTKPLLHTTYYSATTGIFYQYAYKLSNVQNDTDLPVISFSIAGTSSSQTVNITNISATDASSLVVGYQITLTPLPPKPYTADWSDIAPLTFNVPSAGRWDLYAWAQDIYGNVSSYAKATVDVQITGQQSTSNIDTDLPSVNSFTIPATSVSKTVAISSLTASDPTSNVAGYQITLSSTPPEPLTNYWSKIAPSSFDVPATGIWDLYAWAQDSYGNVSHYAKATVNVQISDDPSTSNTNTDLPPADSATVPATSGSQTLTVPTVTSPTSMTNIELPSVDSFIVPATSESQTVMISTFIASSATSKIAGYQVTLTPVPPKLDTNDWGETAPADFQVPSAGRWDLYAWTKDEYGVVSRYEKTTVDVQLTPIYVDKDITDCTTYDPATGKSGSGSYRAYNSISKASQYANDNGSSSSGFIIYIDANDNDWEFNRGINDPAGYEAPTSGPCVGKIADRSQQPNNTKERSITKPTVFTSFNGTAKIEYLCAMDHKNFTNNFRIGDKFLDSAFVMDTDNIYMRIENIEILNINASGNNPAAAIRAEKDPVGATKDRYLFIDRCIIHDCTDGVMYSTGSQKSHLIVTHSQVYENGVYYDTSQSEHHNFYVSPGETILAHNYVGQSLQGQLFKGRGGKVWLLYNRFTDEATNADCILKGQSSNYLADFSWGGEVYIIGNIFYKSRLSANAYFLNYAREADYWWSFGSGGIGSMSNVETLSGENGVSWKSWWVSTSSGTGSWANGNQTGFIRVKDDVDNNYITRSDGPEIAFSKGKVFTYTNPSGSVTSAGGIGWSWGDFTDPTREIHVYYNTFVSDCDKSGLVMVGLHPDTSAAVFRNNIVVDRYHSRTGDYYWDFSAANKDEGSVTDTTNNYTVVQSGVDPGFRAINSFDYMLTSHATSIINKGVLINNINGYQMLPQWQYVHPASKTKRYIESNTIDIGAYEYSEHMNTGPNTVTGLKINVRP